MKGPKQFAVFIASMILAFGVLALMAGQIGSSTPDSMLLALCAVPCVLVLGWAAIGAPLIPQIWIFPVMMPSMMAGFGLLATVSERHPVLSPFLLGAAAAFAFMVVGCCASWLVVRLRSEGGASQDGELVTKIMVAGAVFLFCGALFFQPLMLLINARAEARPPLVLSGVIGNLYETHGKHTSYFVQFSGPAAAYGNTFTHGEFEIGWQAYGTMHLGDRECVTIHTGLLHLHWWAMDDCGHGAQIAAIMRSWQNGDHAAAIAALEAQARRDPHVLDGLTPQWIDQARRAMASTGDLDMARRLLALLASPAYVPSDPDQSTDGYRYDYALMQAGAGDKPGAAATLAQIENPILQMRATLDARLRALMPPGFDARAAVESDIGHQRAVIRKYPNALGPVLRLAELEENLDDGQAMLDLLQASKPGVDHPHMHGTDQQMHAWPWLLSQAYLLVNRYDDAVHALRNSMASGHVNEGNKLELLSIAAVQQSYGHARDALTTLATLNKRPEGWGGAQEAFLRENRSCANYQVGQGDAAQADLTWLHDHAGEASGNLFRALLCMHHDDEAAAILILDVENPAASANARLQVSSFAPYPASYAGDEIHRDLARIAERPDVRAAIERTGGTGTFNIPPL